MTRRACFSLVIALAVVVGVAARASAQELDQPRVTAFLSPGEPATSRPPALMPLYAGLAGLEIYDGLSTFRGLHNGATEQNPLAAGLVGQPAVFWTLKAATTVSTIYFAEQLWRQHHPVKAIMTVAIANGAMALVAAHNASVLASSR
jgi:Domain of unknown function (DUF5658)